MNSVWNESCKFEGRKSLDKDIETEVLVIGAGIAGILIGYFLKDSGKKVTIIEANEMAIEKYREIIRERNIQCDFEELPAYVYSKGKTDNIKEEVEAAKSLGIDAEYIIVATHYPIMNAPGYYFMKMHQERSYVIALENAQETNGMYIDEDKEGYSFRNYNGLLLLGGISQRTGENESGGSYDKLRKAAYVATGFNKWGMTSSMVSAMIITDLVLGNENDYSEIFSPNRFDLSLSVNNIANDLIETSKNYIAQKVYLPSETIEHIPNGQAGIIEYNREKLGVYKNENGDHFIVSTKCPHLRCLLHWNADELTWDCPCHGSRFDYQGRLIDSPAVKNLTD